MAEKVLGKLPVKRDTRNLMASRYLSPVAFPSSYDWQRRRVPMPARTFGNNLYGDCTLASQANALARFERIEQRRTILLPDQLVINNYLQMTGGEDYGWYELDALKRWRTIGFSPTTTRTYTIDAFTQVNTLSIDEIKAALWQFKVIKICFQLPTAWQWIDPIEYAIAPARPGVWDVGNGPAYAKGSWGGHSMSADRYDADGIWVIHTWFYGAVPARQLVTWPAVQRYADEAYSLVDSFDAWRLRVPAFDLRALKADLTKVTAL